MMNFALRFSVSDKTATPIELFRMSTIELRREIKKAVDRMPVDRLPSLADFVDFLTRPVLAERIAAAEKAIATGKGVNWRKVRTDV
jgi:hypothetical protein